jgi:ATP-dependent Clp endopeptidase proteolytic subunit ClpP
MSIQRFQSLKPTADLPQLLAVLGTKKPQNGLSPQGSWYSIKNVSDTEAEIAIYDEIGYFGITANDFIRDITAIKATSITLRINSPGGDVFDGIAIYNAIRRHKAEVTAYVDGLAASAASFIAMAADRLIMSPHSQLMIHEASGLVIGNADDMRQMAELLDKSSDNIAGIYADKAGGTVAEWRARMKDETWMTDREAVELGLADAIDGDESGQSKAQVRNVDFRAQMARLQEDAVFAA